MSEAKPISQMMSELEMRADELNPDRFKNQTEEIKLQMQKKLMNHFIDVFCTIGSAGVQKVLDPEENIFKRSQLLDLSFTKLADKEYRHLAHMAKLLDVAQTSLVQFMEPDKRETFNIFKEVLNYNVILPNPESLLKAKSFGFRNLIIVPGEMTVQETCKNRPNYFDILLRDSIEKDKNITAKRPEKFYTLALSECKESTETFQVELNYDGGKNSLDNIRQEFKKDDLDVTGLTIKEYIFLQFYLVNQQISQGLEPKQIFGFDSASSCILLDDVNINADTQRCYPTYGKWFDNNGENKGVSIVRAAHMEGARKIPDAGARLAVNFAGDRNE